MRTTSPAPHNLRLQLTPNSSLESIRGTVLAAGALPQRWRSALVVAAEAQAVRQPDDEFEMNPEDILSTLAEIAVALIGFAGIVSIFQARGSAWRPDARFWSMLQCGLGAFAFSLLPLPLLASGLASTTTWTLVSLPFAAYGFLVTFLAVRRGHHATIPLDFNAPMFIVFMACSVFVNLLLLYNAARLNVFWPYVTGLVWFEFSAAYLFIRMLQVWLNDRTPN